MQLTLAFCLRNTYVQKHEHINMQLVCNWKWDLIYISSETFLNFLCEVNFIPVYKNYTAGYNL